MMRWNRDIAAAARRNGDFDNPHLLAFGALSTDTEADIIAILTCDADDVAFYSTDEIKKFTNAGWRKIGEGWAL